MSKAGTIVGRTVGGTLIAAAAFLLVGSLPPAFLYKGSAIRQCMERGAPEGALITEAPEGRPEASVGLWPLGLHCRWPAADGGTPIATQPSWSLTAGVYGGVVLAGAGVLLLVRRNADTSKP